MIISKIKSHERRAVSTLDLPETYLHNDTYDKIVMLLKGRLSEFMTLVEPKLYQKCIITNNKVESRLYVNMLKVLYMILRSTLLSYLYLLMDLEV